MNYPNLKAEMSRYGITETQIAQLLGISLKAVKQKIDGPSDFRMNQSWEIKNKYFDRLPIDYLFSMKPMEFKITKTG